MPIDGLGVRIEKFDPKRHDYKGFVCGVERLDNYIIKTAKKHQSKDMTRVYVVVEDGANKILGYHAINLGMMNVDLLQVRPSGAPSHGELPILFLGQVAIDRNAQGEGLGSILMHHVFQKARVISEEAGCYAVVLDVMSDGGEEDFKRRKRWYELFGFQSFKSHSSRMFMTMKQIRAVC